MFSIYIEGKEDNFLTVYLRHIDINQSEDINSFVSINGWQGLKKIINTLIDNKIQGIKNVIILDADSEQNDGGFEKRKNQIEALIDEFDVEYSLFLFPNNKDDGDFETLLENIINQEHRVLLDCFETYEKCISQYKEQDESLKYKAPNRKSKMYSYVMSFPKNREQMEQMKNKNIWFFDNTEYWNLDSEYLAELKKFLKETL